jgi:protein SCO1
MLQPQKRSAFRFFILPIMVALLASTLMIMLTPKKHNPSSMQATILTPPKVIQPFHLTTRNQIFSEKNLIGNWTLLFFGFTHCSDVCPATLAILNKAYQELSPHYPNLQVAFVSIDDNDQPKDLIHYVTSFNKDFMSLHGSSVQRKNVQQQFGIFAGKDNASNLQHSSSVALVNPEGKWVALFAYGMSVEDIVQQFKKIAGN